MTEPIDLRDAEHLAVRDRYEIVTGVALVIEAVVLFLLAAARPADVRRARSGSGRMPS